MLEYDDSAFYYFCLTLLGFYIVPGTIYLIFYQISPVLFPKDDLESKARTEVGMKVKSTCHAAGCRVRGGTIRVVS